jgi:hypothetical protein
MNLNKTLPVLEIRLGLIKASVWLNMTRAGERYNVTICRLYRNGDVWSQSSHFGRDDLLVAAKVLDMAHTWIHQHDRVEKPKAETTDEHGQ